MLLLAVGPVSLAFLSRVFSSVFRRCTNPIVCSTIGVRVRRCHGRMLLSQPMYIVTVSSSVSAGPCLPAAVIRDLFLFSSSCSALSSHGALTGRVLQRWGMACGGVSRTRMLALLARRVHLSFRSVVGHCGWEHSIEVHKLAKSAAAEAPTPTAWITELAIGLRRQADIPLRPARQTRPPPPASVWHPIAQHMCEGGTRKDKKCRQDA